MSKEMKEKPKNTKGITLVALLITIIVLLILAGISLNAIFSQEGIFSKAEQSATEHRAGTVQDEVEIWKREKQIAKYDKGQAATRDEIVDSQKSRGLLTNTEAETAKGTGIVTIGSKTIDYNIEEEATVKFSITCGPSTDTDYTGGNYEVAKGATWLDFFREHYKLKDEVWSAGFDGDKSNNELLFIQDPGSTATAYFYKIFIEDDKDRRNPVHITDEIKNGSYITDGRVGLGSFEWGGLWDLIND